MSWNWRRAARTLMPDMLSQRLRPPAELDPHLLATVVSQRRSALVSCLIGVPTLLCFWIYTLLFKRDNLLMLYMPLLLAAIILGLTLQALGRSRLLQTDEPRSGGDRATHTLIWSTLIFTLICLSYRAAYPLQFDDGMQKMVALMVVMAGVSACLRFKPLQSGLILATMLLLHSLPVWLGALQHTLGTQSLLLGVVTDLMLGSVLALVFSSAWTQVALGRSEASNTQMEYLSRTDHLTGLCNRRSLYGSIEKLMGEVVSGTPRTQPDDDLSATVQAFSIALLDVDHFKSVNDTFGHASGDRVLCGVADVLVGFMRQSDLAGRWGGEEFVLVLPGADVKQGAVVAERLRAGIEAARMLPGRTITASFGVTGWQPGDTLEALMARADAAMYQAKRGGRNRVEVKTTRGDEHAPGTGSADRTELKPRGL